MDSMIDLGFIELPQTLVAFVNTLSDDDKAYLLHHTFPEDWEGNDIYVVEHLKAILFCVLCNQHAEEGNYDNHCEGCPRNPHQ